MSRTIDFSGVGDYKPAPRGVYTIEFTKFEFAEIKSGKNAGNEQVKAQYTIVDEFAEEPDPATGEPIKVQGKVIFRNYQLLQQSLWVLKQDAIALGIDPSRFEGELDVEQLLADMVGRQGIGTVSVRSYVYPEGHAKFGQTRYDNEIDKIEQAEIPEVLRAGGSRHR